MSKLDNKNVSKHLGKTSKYKSEYDEKLLVREPRSSNRKHLKIKDKDLPFVGYDVWNGYEVSGLMDNGMPVNAVAKVVYACDSKYIVESKSMKLYWNSFNMTKFGETMEDVVSGIEFHAAADLSKLLQTEVKVKLFSCDTDLRGVSNPFLEAYDGLPNSLAIISTKKYVRLEHFLTTGYRAKSEINITKYKEDPSIFDTKYTSMAELNNLNVMSSLLKSNCRVTSQPDWGDVFIHIEGQWLPGVRELLEYIISFRDENHFHEEICETIYKRLYDRFSPRELMVACLYSRRGGWDINPVRASKIDLIDDMMWDETIPWIKTIRQ